MEEKEEKKEALEEHHVEPKMGLNIWKFLTLFLLAAILVGGAYFIGTQKGERVAIAPTPSPSSSVSPTATSSPSASIAPTPTKTPTKTVEAGDNIGVFFPYRTQVPIGWQPNHSNTKGVLDVLEISRGGYKIRIQQAGGEGSSCNYGAPKNEPFTQNYSTYIEFQSLDENFRRSGDSGGTGWTICHKNPNGWQFPTLYGYISYSNPSNPDEKILKEMDSILSTLVKQ